MPDPMKPIGARVTITVPCWNQFEWTKRMWESAERFINPSTKLTVKWVFVNNGSTDGTEEFLNALTLTHPNVFVIHNLTNQGFLKAMNQARKLAEGHWLWLNNDTEFLRYGSLEKLVDTLESHPAIGAVGPVSDGVMGPQNIEFNAAHPKRHEVRFLIGFCMLVKDGVWQKVGELDPAFDGVGNDDLDYSFRIRKLGLRLICARSVLVHHVSGGTQPYTKEWIQTVGVEGGRKVLKDKWGTKWLSDLYAPLTYAKHRVLLAIPTYSAIHPEAYANHLIGITDEIKKSKATDLQISLCILARNTVNRARRKAAEMALNGGFTHLLFLDDDMLCPRKFIHQLLKWEADIISGLAHTRIPPHHPAAFIDHPDPRKRHLPIGSWPKEKVIEVDNVGAACLLIRTEVFKKMGTDVFQFTPHTIRGKRITTLGTSEDIWFCKEARRHGFKIYLDTSLKFAHLSVPLAIDTSYYEQYTEKHPELDHVPLVPYRSYEQARDWVVDFHQKFADKEKDKQEASLSIPDLQVAGEEEALIFNLGKEELPCPPSQPDNSELLTQPPTEEKPGARK